MAATPRIGTVFAGYRIEALRGRGGMSVVYRAENPRLGNVVALKLLSAALAEDETFRERFVRESRTAASIAHPNIIPIHDAGDAEGVLYIAMRYVEGPDLKARVQDGLPAGRALLIGAQVASALDAAHARGMVHRDVKPANVLIEAGAEGADHAYLADFGLTKHVESHSGLTGTGQFVGTIDYMAPEQIEGRDVDARADIYALGCVLFECLGGAPPFRRESDVAVIWAHMRDEPPSLSSVRPGFPAAADRVFAKALAKEPRERHDSCGELVRELRSAFGEQAADPADAPTVVRGTQAARRRRLVRPALAVVAGFALGAAAASAALLATRDSSTRIETRSVRVPVRAVSFRTPTGSIGCVGGPTLRCDIRSGLKPLPPKPASCKRDWGFGYAVGQTGISHAVCASDTAIDRTARVLRYGTSWRRGGLTCLSRPTGLRCTNRSRHGFFLSRSRSYRF